MFALCPSFTKQCAASAAAFTLLAAGAFAQAGPSLPPPPPMPPAMITVTGEAIAKLAPNQVTLPVTVYAEDKNLNVAKEAADRKLAILLDQAKQVGAPAEKLKTQYTQISPQYDYDPKSGKQRFRSYMVTSSIEVTLPDPAKLGVLINGLTEQGIDRIGSAQFGLDDEKKARDELLGKAVQDARAKADAMATALGVHVGKPVAVSEGGAMPPSPPMPRPMMAMAKMADGAESLPELPGGRVEIRQNVTVSFTIEN